MSSYFVNSLATCYNQGVGDGGGGEAAPRDYPQTGSPYRGYSISNPPYPYGSPSPNTGHNGDYYMTQRLSHPPLGRDTTSPPNNVMGTENTAQTLTPADYSTTSRYNNTANHSSTSNSSELSPIDSSPQPPPQQTTIANNSNNNNSNNNNNNTSSTLPSPDSSQSPPASNTISQRQNSTGSEQSSSSPPPGPQNQTSASSPGSQPHIYPWMRRMHVGHGKHSTICYVDKLLV